MSVKSDIVLPKGATLIESKQKEDSEIVLPKGATLLETAKKKEDGGTPSKASPSGIGAQPATTQQPSTSVSGTNPVGPKDWSSVENSFKVFKEKQQAYTDAQNYPHEQSASPGGFVIANANFSAQYQKEAKEKYDKALQQKEQAVNAHKNEIYEPIKNLIDTGKYKDYFDAMGNFKAADAISYFDNLTKANKAGNYTRDMMVSMLKQSGQYEIDQPARKKLREEEYKKQGIDVSKYGINLLDKLTSKQKSNVDLLEKETKAKATNLLETLKPKATEFGQQYMQQVDEIKGQFQQKQISEEDANNKLKELNNKYHSQISALDKEYQNQVRSINVKAQDKYGRIGSEIQNIEKSVTDEMIWKSIPDAERKKIESANNKVENEIQRGHNILRQGLDIMYDVGQTPLVGLFEKSVQSGWYSGLANIGGYLSSKGYNNSFTRYLQGKEYEASVNAPAEYAYKEDFLKRAVSGTGSSLGASAPIMIPSIGIVAGTSGLGLPEIVGTIASGLTSYYGEKAQNTGQVYQQILDQTGDPAKAIEGAKRYEDKQAVMMPLYFIEAAGLQNLLKGGGIKKALTGTVQELSQELPTEYWQNYTQAQETEGYEGSLGSYIKEHPETTLDVIASTLGQSGMVSMAGKVFNQISSLVPQAKAQYYADILGKHGIDFAMENLQHQFNTGVIDEKQFQAEQDKIMLAAKKLKDFEGLGLKGDDAKAYFTLTESANRLKKAIGETDDEGLRIGYEAQLKQNQQQLDELVKGKGAYAIFTMPGGGEQTKIVPLSGIEKLEKDGHLNTLIHLSDKVEVKGDENLSKQLQERKQQIGNPSAPEGFYSSLKSTAELIEENRTLDLKELMDKHGVQEGQQGDKTFEKEKNDINDYYNKQLEVTQKNEEKKGEVPKNTEKSKEVIDQAIKDDNLKGIYADNAISNPESFFKEISDQIYGINADGTKSLQPDAEKATREQFGDEIVDHAKELFPIKTYEDIQQNSTKANEAIAPVLQRINNADYINEKDLDEAANHLYDVLDQIDKSDMTDEQKKSSANLIEPLISKIEGYDFRTKTETSTVTEAKTASIPTKTERQIKPALEQSAGSKATITSPDGSKTTGTLNIKSGQYVLDVPQGQQRIIGEKAITDRDLTLPTEEEMENPIKFDKDGNVESITVKDRNGNLIEIKDGEKALDMAIQLRAEAIGEVPAQLFNNTYEEVQKEISEEKLVSESKPTEKVTPTETKEATQSEPSKGEIKTQEDFEKELKKALGLEGGALPKLGEINKDNNTRNRNEDISKYTPLSIIQKAKEFYKNDPLINRVISFLEPIIKANPNIKIDTEFKWDVNEYEGHPITNQALGYSFPSGNVILNFNKISDYDSLYRAALHEFLHAATRAELYNNKAFREDVQEILGDIRRAMKIPAGDTELERAVRESLIGQDLEGKYGITNEHELLAEVFTNQKFSDFLKGLEYKGDNLLHRLFLAIAKYLSQKYKTLVDAKENLNVDNIADYLMGLTESVVAGKQEQAQGNALPSLKGESEKSVLDDKIKNVIARAGPSLTNEQIRDTIKKLTGLDDNIINNLINEVRGKDISSQKTKTNEKTKAKETEGRQGLLGGDVPPGIGKEGVPGSEPEAPSSKPPKPPVTEPARIVGSPKEEWTAIRKAKMEEIKAVRNMFEDNAERKKWAGIIDSALNNLQEMYPDKNLYDAAKTRVGYFATLFDNKIPFNPTSEDLAVMEYFKAETEKAINDITGWDSQNDTERIYAIAQYKSFNDDLVAVAKAINPSEAGRAFGFRQSEMNLDPEYGLQVRRMQLLDAKEGEKLTDEEKAWSSEQWDKEKELMRQEQNLRENRMTEEFDKRISDLKKGYDEKLKQAKQKAPTKKEKSGERRDDYFKNKGKEWADKIRKGKLGGTQMSIPGVTPLVNLAIEGVAKLVEVGFTIAEAIDEYVKDNRLGDSDSNIIKNYFNNFIDKQIKQEESLEKIKELAEGNKVTSITTDMVSKNLIKDFVESHIGEVEPENLLEHVTSKLEETLPNLTKEKLTEAYLKTGEFKIPTLKQLQSEHASDKAKLQKIAKIEKDINDLKNKKDVYSRSGNKSQERVVDKDIEAREKELKNIMIDAGLKTSNEDKFSKASNETRAQSHNDRLNALTNKIDDLLVNGNLTPEQKSALTKLKGQLDASKIKLDENSKLSQKVVMDNADNILKKTKADFDKELKLSDMLSVAEVRKGLQQAVDRFNSEKEESEQKLKLERTKRSLERSNDERQRQINAGEFNDEKVPTILKSTDSELIKLQIRRNKLDSGIRKKQSELGEKNKSKTRKALELTRGLYVAALIYRFGTFAKVGAAAIIRPSMEGVTKTSFGKIFQLAFPEFYKRAKAGGESSSWRSVKESYTALLRQVGEKKISDVKEKANDQYNVDRDAYNAYEKIAALSPNDKGVQNKLKELKNNMNKSLLDATGAFIYDFIGGSSIKDSLDALLYRSNEIESQFGYLDKESIKDGNAVDKLNYIIGFIGRSHAAMKTYSARANFAAGFVARLEDAMNNGIDISDSDEILKIGHESYLDWERGKYQQKNLVTDLWNEVTRRVENYAKGTAWEKYSKAIAEGLRFDVAITRVPVNILHEAVMEYTVGSFRAIYKMGQAHRAANQQVKLNTDFDPGTKEFKDAIKEQISKLDANQAATIARCFRKGGFGLGLYAFAAISGLIAFGGFHHKGEKKKKEEELEEGELNPGEIMIGKNKQAELLSKIIEHTPAAYPALFGLNLSRVYKDNIEKGKTTPDAAMAATLANLEAMQDAIPQAKVVNPIGITTDVTKGALRQLDKFWEWTDVDENGDVINRKPMDFNDQIKLLRGDRKNVLTEDNYKSATSIMKEYNSAISDLHKQKAGKEQIEELKKERDDKVKQIYELNKEGQ